MKESTGYNGKLTGDKRKLRKVARDLAVKKDAEVARKYGVHQSSVARFKSREDVQAIIREESEKLLAMVPDVRELYGEVLRKGKWALDEEPGDERRRANNCKLVSEAVKVGDAIGKATGLFPSHLGNLTVNTAIFGDSPSLSPVLLSLLSSAVPSLHSPPVPVVPDSPPLEVSWENVGGGECGGDQGEG